VTTCAACMWVIRASPTSLGVPMPSSLSLITPTPFHLLFRYNKQAPHSSRHHLLVQIPEATRAAHSSARGALLAERCVASCVSMPVQ
jgi:hypothetical protein